MKPHLNLLCATVALVLAAFAAPPVRAQGNSNCANGNVPADKSCVIQGYLATFSSSAAGTITLGSLTIDLTAGSVTMTPPIQRPCCDGGPEAGGTTPVKVTTVYIPAGAASGPPGAPPSSPTYTVTMGSAATTVSVDSASAASITVQPLGNGGPVTITAGCTITFNSSGANPTSC